MKPSQKKSAERLMLLNQIARAVKLEEEAHALFYKAERHGVLWSTVDAVHYLVKDIAHKNRLEISQNQFKEVIETAYDAIIEATESLKAVKEYLKSDEGH